MKSASIGTPAPLPSRGAEGGERRSGFTLLEALVALALVLAFAAALGPYLFQARRIMVDAETPGRRAGSFAHAPRRPLRSYGPGEVSARRRAGGLHGASSPSPCHAEYAGHRERPEWSAFRVVVSVALGSAADHQR